MHYPALASDPGHERATRLMDGYGGMLSFGGVESLIERRAPGLLRLSVGCEHVEGLWDDLEQAL